MLSARLVCSGVLLCAIFMAVCVAEPNVFGTAEGTDHNILWTPVEDSVYLQEASRIVKTDAPVTSVAVNDGTMYGVMNGRLHTLQGEQLVPVAGLDAAVAKLVELDGALWALGSGLHRLTGATWQTLADGDFRDVTSLRGEVYALRNNALFHVSADGAMEELAGGEGGRAPNNMLAIEPYAESLYILRPGGLVIYTFDGFDDVHIFDWGQLPSQDLRDIMAVGGRLYIATAKGIGQLRGMALTNIQGEDGLPYEETTCLAHGFAGDMWIGTEGGAVRYVDGDFQLFPSTRWLPVDQVNAIACGDNVTYVATDAGLGIIDYEPYTLLKKAAYYEQRLEEYGHKRLGFTHKLEWEDDAGEWVREISDNDAGYSCHYLSAMCFKYAATGDESARKEAVNSFLSQVWVEQATPIEGFPARSMWAKGEKGHQAQHGSGGLPAEWHNTADGKFEWKGDTSSDETDAHFYAVATFHDLVAKGEEKEMAARHLNRIASHIMENGFLLRDIDGQPTRWARWDPEYLQRPYGFYARGLNGMEIFNYLRTAEVISDDPKFQAGINQLMDWGYHNEIMRTKLTFPPQWITQFDDRLAFLSYYSLLRYEYDPHMRSILMRGLERTWEVERLEQNPWYNFIYGALTGHDCETEVVVPKLREWPLDLINYPFDNTDRDDLHPEEGYEVYSVGPKAFSPRILGGRRLDGYTTVMRGGSGREMIDPSGWLDMYWMGRYYGMIKAPTVNDKDLLTVPKSSRQLGATPYDGPPRPEIKLQEPYKSSN